MKKLLTAFVAGTLALGGSAYATETRINSLSAGGPGNGALNEKSITIKDSANIDVLPQTMVGYKNSVDVDNTVGSSYGSMNIRYALSDDAVLTLFGKRSTWQGVTSPTSIDGKTAPGIAGYTPVPKDPTNHQFGIGFGMKAGESLRLGTTLSIGGHRNDGPSTSQNSNTLVNFAAGIGFDLSETNSLDFGLGLVFGSFTNIEGTQDRWLSNGLFGLTITGKGEFQVHQIAKLVPYLRFGYDSRGVKHNARTDEAGLGNDAKQGTVNNTTLSLGSDLAISPVEGVLIQPGIGLAFRSSTASGNSAPAGATQNVESSQLIMPYYGFAAEAKAFDWMVLRLGARQTIVKQDDGNTLPNTGPTAPSNEKHTSDVVNTVTTGFGFKLMGWQLDMNINPQFFNNGPYIVTGNATTPFGVDFALGYDW